MRANTLRIRRGANRIIRGFVKVCGRFFHRGLVNGLVNEEYKQSEEGFRDVST